MGRGSAENTSGRPLSVRIASRAALHTNQDTYERLSPKDLKQAAIVEATFLYDAAMRDEMLPRKPIPFSQKHNTNDDINFMPDVAPK
jgi:Zn-dependent M28 family amino/carboxypeptidase